MTGFQSFFRFFASFELRMLMYVQHIVKNLVYLMEKGGKF